ncbi:unnamed protein product [Prorocentrum cordatum]|uniref:Uncharacterized protein n=1 Tax=Prorocentrum cordatum TaxID=2364126 RepID=A0ABN9RDK4_9DINO|nr:unnamed protein product [Polarella glacialis]
MRIGFACGPLFACSRRPCGRRLLFVLASAVLVHPRGPPAQSANPPTPACRGVEAGGAHEGVAPKGAGVEKGGGAPREEEEEEEEEEEGLGMGLATPGRKPASNFADLGGLTKPRPEAPAAGAAAATRAARSPLPRAEEGQAERTRAPRSQLQASAQQSSHARPSSTAGGNEPRSSAPGGPGAFPAAGNAGREARAETCCWREEKGGATDRPTRSRITSLRTSSPSGRWSGACLQDRCNHR